MTTVPNNAVLQWKEDEKFEILGKDLELIIQLVRAELNTPESQRVMGLQLANDALNKVLEQGLKDNKIAIVPPQEEKTANASSSY